MLKALVWLLSLISGIRLDGARAAGSCLRVPKERFQEFDTIIRILRNQGTQVESISPAEVQEEAADDEHR